ncbi:hypothetical protein SPRG_14590 [Saprolegnia parasitica CBS 223.65]|uniref:ATP-binding Cassette (ABC) Superfamily n=1 Tax=Saprolegnia parasitica (strain CBS 223.65) TaxID=695850 RepID=A0A067BTG2_SAPPC|nr:hypothetical protein SPRG_14590 [Saprolegnia parasitica CBS 223.65]KDO20110.1 hypothetical protein SPRG_14590 [Saprolegnia parasitica CBS 223.65]|eukprot:XP_012209154.1 hypothetical protein SPRG_14590 [Saprolegnia parasitica CBS 223.65]
MVPQHTTPISSTPMASMPMEGLTPLSEHHVTPILDAPPVLPRSMRFGTLRVVDHRRWHYSLMGVLALDFLCNCIAVSFTSKDSFIQYAHSTRLVSAACMAVYAIDMLLRLVALRGAMTRSGFLMADTIAFLLLGVGLALRYVFADDLSTLKIVANGWTTTFETNTKFVSNQVEMYFDAAYTVLLAARIVLKPRARMFSKKLHTISKYSCSMAISIASVKAALRHVPSITAVAIEQLDTELRIVCGRDDGDMTRAELLAFLERALPCRPRHMTASAFLSHLRDIDARFGGSAYGAYDVVRSTLQHWSTQSVDLALTTFVVLVSASILPLLAYFLKLCTDQGFPASVWVYALHNFDDFGLDQGLSVHASFKWKNQTSNDNGTLVDLPFVPWHSLLEGVIGILGISIPFVVADYAMGYFQSKMIANATKRLQDTLFDVLLRQPTEFFAARSDGDLNNLFQSDIARVNAMWQAVFWNLMNPIVSIVVGFVYLMYSEPTIGAMSFAFSAIIVTSGPQGLAARKSQQFGSQSAYAAAEFQNAVACHKVVRAYHIQDPLLTKFGAHLGGLRRAQFAKDFWSGVVQIYIESGMFIFVQIMTACLVIKVFHGDITSGDFFSCVTMLNRISTPVTVLGGFMRVAIGNASSLQRIDEIVRNAAVTAAASDADDANKPALPRMTHSMTVTDVCFRYDANAPEYVLRHVHATFHKGEYTCIVGPSGCGKSTLLACLMQFYTPSEGTICVDGLSIASYSKASFSNQTAVVFQDGGILNGSILDNIAYGRDGATREACLEAAKLAECHVFVNGLKDGYDTIIGQHAVVNLSGGQLQRICLARALVRQPSLLLLDEATSALDPETEASIVQTLEKLAKQLHMTIVSVTHRLSTARNADKILVMQSGAVIQEGTYHELLMAPNSVFAELVRKMEATEAAPSVHFRTLDGPRTTATFDTHRALELFGSDLDARAVSRKRSENGSALDGRRHTTRSNGENGSFLLI